MQVIVQSQILGGADKEPPKKKKNQNSLLSKMRNSDMSVKKTNILTDTEHQQAENLIESYDKAAEVHYDSRTTAPEFFKTLNVDDDSNNTESVPVMVSSEQEHSEGEVTNDSQLQDETKSEKSTDKIMSSESLETDDTRLVPSTGKDVRHKKVREPKFRNKTKVSKQKTKEEKTGTVSSINGDSTFSPIFVGATIVISIVSCLLTYFGTTLFL